MSLLFISFCTVGAVGRDSAVGIATRYRLDGPGIESRWGRLFPHPLRPALGANQPPMQWVPGLYRGVKRPGRGIDHPPPNSADVKERVELYLFSTSGPSCPVIEWTFTVYFCSMSSYCLQYLLDSLLNQNLSHRRSHRLKIRPRIWHEPVKTKDV